MNYKWFKNFLLGKNLQNYNYNLFNGLVKGAGSRWMQGVFPTEATVDL